MHGRRAQKVALHYGSSLYYNILLHYHGRVSHIIVYGVITHGLARPENSRRIERKVHQDGSSGPDRDNDERDFLKFNGYIHPGLYHILRYRYIYNYNSLILNIF